MKTFFKLSNRFVLKYNPCCIIFIVYQAVQIMINLMLAFSLTLTVLTLSSLPVNIITVSDRRSVTKAELSVKTLRFTKVPKNYN